MIFTSTDSNKQETHVWLTPLSLIRELGDFDLDPCAYPSHRTAKKLICLPNDGLIQEWKGRVWLNPPYGNHAKDWLLKLSNHGNGIALVFCRLETKWLKPFLQSGFFVIDGRLSFESPVTNKKGNAGAASILIPFGRKNIGAILISNIKGEWYQ
mgnify:CR=1 FL=1